jgi:hypothetical protein
MYLYLRGIAGMMALHHTCELSNDKVSSRLTRQNGVLGS